MIKKVLFIISLISFVIITSCTNIIENHCSDISFKLGENAAKQISKTTTNITDDSELVITCSFDGVKLGKKVVSVKKRNLADTVIKLDGIPLEKEFKIIIEVSFNSQIVYRGNSDFIVLTAENNKVQIDIKASNFSVKDFNVTVHEGTQLKLTWTNPEYEDVKYINFKCLEDPNFNISTEASPNMPGEIIIGNNDIPKGKGTYHFTARGVDSEGITGIAAEAAPLLLPKINDFIVPDLVLGKSNYEVTITGENFSGKMFQGSVLPKEGTAIPANVNVSNDNILKLSFSAPNNKNSYTVNIICLSDMKSSSFDIREYEIGDIVYSDGGISTVDLSNESRKPIAVIFRKARPENGPNPAISALGIGLKESSELKWAEDGTKGTTISFTDIRGEPKLTGLGAAGDPGMTFQGPSDGKISWSNICEEDSNAETNQETNYPAFYWVNNYGTSNNIITGWFMPSIQELNSIYKKKETLNKALNLVKGTTLGNKYYWSCSQNIQNAWSINFGDADVSGLNKITKNFVRAIHEFN